MNCSTPFSKASPRTGLFCFSIANSEGLARSISMMASGLSLDLEEEEEVEGEEVDGPDCDCPGTRMAPKSGSWSPGLDDLGLAAFFLLRSTTTISPSLRPYSETWVPIQ